MEEKFSRRELEEFVSHKVWKYIITTSIERTSQLSEDNNSINPFTEPSRIARNQGMLMGIGEIIDIPALLAEQIEFESNKRKEEEMEEDG